MKPSNGLKAPAWIVGPSGTGKTMLCQVLAQQFRSQFAVATLAERPIGHPPCACSRRSCLNWACPLSGHGRRRTASLTDRPPGHRASLPSDGLLLVIDEAHSLPWRLMEELRMITNLVRDGQPRVRLILAGPPLLEERFATHGWIPSPALGCSLLFGIVQSRRDVCLCASPGRSFLGERHAAI